MVPTQVSCDLSPAVLVEHPRGQHTEGREFSVNGKGWADAEHGCNMTNLNIDEILEQVRLTQQVRVTLYSIGNLHTMRTQHTELK